MHDVANKAVIQATCDLIKIIQNKQLLFQQGGNLYL